MKKILQILVILISVSLLANYTYINPLGPTLVPIARLIQDSDTGDQMSGLEMGYWRNIDEALSAIVSGKAELGLLPITIGAKMASEGVDIKLAAISMWNGFFFVSNNEPINNLSDLKGKAVYTLHAPGQTADIILKGAIEKAGYEDDIKLVYVSGPESVQLLAAKRADVLLVPEPFVSLAITKVPTAKRGISIKDLWEEFSGEEIDIPTSGVFVSGSVDTDFADTFLLLYKQSLELSLDNLQGTSEVVSQKMGGFPVPVLKNAIQNIDFVYVDAVEGKELIENYLETLKTIDEKLVGNVDYEDFFYNYEK